MTIPARTGSKSISSGRQRLAAAVLVLAALGAVASFIVAASDIRATGPEAFVVESWRMFGFLVFAGIYLLLAYRPKQYPGIWELVILHKVAVAIFLLGAGSGAVGATSVAIIDGVLALALVGAYLLVGGYRNWSQLRRSAPEPNV